MNKKEQDVMTKAFIGRALTYKLKEMFPEQSPKALTKLQTLVHRDLMLSAGRGEAVVREELVPLGLATDTNMTNLVQVAIDVTHAIIGLGIDMEESGGEQVRWTKAPAARRKKA